jgi:hypothetical protein
MVFSWLGDSYDLQFVECVSTVPFGFVYMPYKTGGFAVNGYNPHDGTERALKTLVYKYEFKCFQSDLEAFTQLREALKEKPVILGPLDMGFLVYDPFCRFKNGSDHYIVALETERDHFIVHDPDGYPCVPIATRDLSNAWKAEAIGYKKGSYSMWTVNKRTEVPSTETVYRTTLLLGLQNLRGYKRARKGRTQTTYFGCDAIAKLAKDIGQIKSRSWLRFYSTFSFRVSAQRCYDSSIFIRNSPIRNDSLLEASKVRMRQALQYARCQADGARMKFNSVAETLLETSKLEDEFERQMEKGLQGLTSEE